MNGFVHVSPLSLCSIVCVCLCAHSSILFDCYYDDLHVRRDDCVICLFYLCNLCLAKRGFKIAHYVYDDHSYNQMSATAERWRDRDLQSCAIPYTHAIMFALASKRLSKKLRKKFKYFRFFTLLHRSLCAV